MLISKDQTIIILTRKCRSIACLLDPFRHSFKRISRFVRFASFCLAEYDGSAYFNSKCPKRKSNGRKDEKFLGWGTTGFRRRWVCGFDYYYWKKKRRRRNRLLLFLFIVMFARFAILMFINVTRKLPCAHHHPSNITTAHVVDIHLDLEWKCMANSILNLTAMLQCYNSICVWNTEA